MDLIGIENEAEFFPAGTLSDVLKEELQDITSRWSGLDKSAHPIERLSRISAQTIDALRQSRNTADRARQTEIMREVHHALVSSLGYTWKTEIVSTALSENPVIPIVSRVADASGRDALWVFEAPNSDADDKATDPLSICFQAEQFPAEMLEGALLDKAIEEFLADGVFELPNSPHHILVLGFSQIILIDKRKWPARSVLRFDLQEIFARDNRDTITVMACLISREARVPDQGTSLSERLEEEAQRNANAVTTSLKRTVRDAIEILGQEALEVAGGKYPSNFPDTSRRGVWIDGPELSKECLRYMYRLLFLFYAEANPRLKLLDLKNPIYAAGYSLETLRELESKPLRTVSDREGTFLWKSLQKTLGLIYSGLDLVDEEKGTGLRLPAVKVSLLDPDSTPLLKNLYLRNEAIQKVIRLLSLRSTGKSTGRISYAKLGIGQLGAVYETLISFTGVVAKTDLIELNPSKDRTAASDVEESDQTSEVDDEAEEDIAEAVNAEQEDGIFRRDKVDPLAPSWFVPRSRINEFAPEDIVFNGPEARIYPKGSFIYRLAGRDREKSASYYTPEPLARLLVKHALIERCKDLPADELLELKILEPAMGSAAFLVETTNQLANLYLERKQKETGKTIPQDQVAVEKQKVRGFIADRNCFGVDLNPIAVELGAISLWLNSLHDSDFSPWFGDQLHAGNSLIGARRASYPPSLLTARSRADLWLKVKPNEIGWREPLPENHVWQWLLPANDMASFDKDKSITPFAGNAQDHIKEWRKGGFFKALELHEVKLAQKLSRVAEALFKQVADDLSKTREATNDEITIWPNKLMPGSKGLDFRCKSDLTARLTGADRAANTLPYKRLKTAMDAWCALWLWPLDKADKLPSRAEFLQGMAMILEGGFTADGSLNAPSIEEFSDPTPDFFDQLEPNSPARDLSEAAETLQDSLFRETNVEALIKTFDWLGVAVEVATRERFVHFDLIFADVMKSRGGFDIIVGNPPWAKPSWKESDILGDIDPGFVTRQLSASDTATNRHQILADQRNLKMFLEFYTSTKGAINTTGSVQNFPIIGAGSNNLYRCFLDLSFRVVSPLGNVCLIHQDGHLMDPRAGEFRSEWYSRIIFHVDFVNAISSKNFAEVAHYARFSLNIYRGSPNQVNFKNITYALLPSQVNEILSHNGLGNVPTIKTTDNDWDTRGHKNRLVNIDLEELSAISKLMEGENTAVLESRFLQPYSESFLNIFYSLSSAPSLSDIDTHWQMSSGWNETGSQREGIICKAISFRNKTMDLIYSGPMLHVGNPFYKTPNSEVKTKADYEVIDLVNLPSGYLQRSVFTPKEDEKNYKARITACSWNSSEVYTSRYRFAFRKMINLHSERSLIGAILPPDVSHIDSVQSVGFEKSKDLLSFSANFMSIVFDFLIKALGQTALHVSTVSSLPFVAPGPTARLRALQLNCLTEEYENLWNECLPHSTSATWSSKNAAYSHLGDTPVNRDWDRSVSIRGELNRRLALIEIDVLVAQALGLKIQQLIDLYLNYFPVLVENEKGTWYDQNGRIVWTCSKGLPNVGWLDERGKSPGRAAWERILADDPSELHCTAIDDTKPGGPREIIRHFVGPFTRCDRVEDYKQAWAHFERLKNEGAA